jgi:hypothetical protein
MLSGLQIASQFKAFRDSIDMIIQCLKSIVVFTIILLYFILCFSVFFYYETGGEGKEVNT